jgi:hypothetical protein
MLPHPPGKLLVIHIRILTPTLRFLTFFVVTVNLLGFEGISISLRSYLYFSAETCIISLKEEAIVIS